MYKKIFIFLIVLMMTFVSGNVFSDSNVLYTFESNTSGWKITDISYDESDNFLKATYENDWQDRTKCYYRNRIAYKEYKGIFLVSVLTYNDNFNSFLDYLENQTSSSRDSQELSNYDVDFLNNIYLSSIDSFLFLEGLQTRGTGNNESEGFLRKYSSRDDTGKEIEFDIFDYISHDNENLKNASFKVKANIKVIKYESEPDFKKGHTDYLTHILKDDKSKYHAGNFYLVDHCGFYASFRNPGFHAATRISRNPLFYLHPITVGSAVSFFVNDRFDLSKGAEVERFNTIFDNSSQDNLAKAIYLFDRIDSDKGKEDEEKEKSFENCGEGTIKDTENNLCWDQNLSHGPKNWNDANNFCNNLNLGGHNDWSLPTKEQLETLVDKEQTNNCNYLNEIGFSGCSSSIYFTKDEVENNMVEAINLGNKESFRVLKVDAHTNRFVCVRQLEGKDTTESVERPTEDVLTENYFRKLSIEFNPEIYNQNIVCETTVNNICYVRSNNQTVIIKVENSDNQKPLFLYTNTLNENNLRNINISNPESINNEFQLGSNRAFRSESRQFSINVGNIVNTNPYFLVVRQANAVSDFIYFIPVSDDEFEKVLKYKLLQKILNKSYCIGCEIPDWIRESGIDLRDTEVCEDVDKCVPLTPKKEDPVDEDYICEEKIVRINIDGVERMEPISICSIPASGIPEIEIVSREICDLRIRSPFNIDPMTPMPSCLISIDDNLYRPIEIREITTPKIPEKDLKDICSDFLDTEDDLIDCFTYFDVDMKLSVVDLETSSSGYVGADLDPEKTYRFYFNQRYNSLNTSIQNIQSRAVYSYFTEVTNFFNMSDNEKAMFFALIGGESSFLSNQKGDLKEGTTDQYQSFGPAQININVWVREGKNYVTSEPNVIKYLNEYFKGNNLSEITTNQEYLTFANTVKENDKNGLILGAAVFLDYLDKIRANPNLQKYLMEGNEYSLEYVNVNLAFILFYGHQIGYPNAKFVIDRFQIPENNKILEIADRQSTENNNKLNRVAAYGGLQKLAWYIFYLDHFDVDFYD